jgi:hypothetical protein
MYYQNHDSSKVNVKYKDLFLQTKAGDEIKLTTFVSFCEICYGTHG